MSLDWLYGCCNWHWGAQGNNSHALCWRPDPDRMTQSNCRKCWDVWNRMLPGTDLQYMCRNPTLNSKLISMRTKFCSSFTARSIGRGTHLDKPKNWEKASGKIKRRLRKPERKESSRQLGRWHPGLSARTNKQEKSTDTARAQKSCTAQASKNKTALNIQI